jgi:phosphonate transport system permease protein
MQHPKPLRDPAAASRLFSILVGVAVLWPLGIATEFRPWILFEAESVRATGRFLGSFWPIAVDPDFLRLIARETWRTVAMATVGISLAMLLAIPLSLLAARVLSLSALTGIMARGPFWLRQSVRWVLIILRSVPELVWALVFVRVVGLGPTAGVLAIALTYVGMLGKVYAEILESADQHATRTLLQNGSSRLQAFCFALLPACASELTSYTIYRWECAIRSSVVLGFVGAGGLGQEMDNSMKMFAGAEVATMLLVFIALVALADRGSSAIRKVLG